MLDKYFKYTIFIDFLIALLLGGLTLLLIINDSLSYPQSDLLVSMTSDMANISFTSAGFVLTFLTLLVSFKSSIKPLKKNKKKSLEGSYIAKSLFNLFLNSALFDETIKHLKNAVKELIVIAILGYVLKLILPKSYIHYLFFYNLIALSTVSLVLWRSLLVLSGVLKVQKENQSN